MSCFIFSAGDYYGITRQIHEEDYVIAADAGWKICQREGIEPKLLLGDFDSLDKIPDFHNIEKVPVEKDDTDTMLAVKRGIEKGETEFYLYGGMGGERTDHTIANMQALSYICHHGGHGWLYGNHECFTAICNESITFPAKPSGILSVFCFGEAAEGVTIKGGHYEVQNVSIAPDFPIGVSNHFEGKDIFVEVKKGTLLIGLHDE